MVYFFHSLSILSASTTLIGASFGQLIGMVVLLARAKVQVSKWRFVDILKFLDFRPSFHLGIFSITNSLTTLDQVILGITSGQIQTGYYGAVSKWFAPLGILSGSVSVVVANDAAKRHQSAFSAVASDRLTWFSLGCVGLLAGLAGLFGSEIVPLVLGSSYANSQELFLFLALSAALALVNAPVAALLQYFHFDKAVSVCIGTLGLIYLLLLALLLPHGFRNPALFLSQMQLALQAGIFMWLTFLVFLQRRSRNREA